MRCATNCVNRCNLWIVPDSTATLALIASNERIANILDNVHAMIPEFLIMKDREAPIGQGHAVFIFFVVLVVEGPVKIGADLILKMNSECHTIMRDEFFLRCCPFDDALL